MATKKRARKAPSFSQKYIDAVNLGVKWLDLTLGRKEWLKRMGNMQEFNIGRSSTCVAGNVFKDFYFSGESSGYDKFMDFMNEVGSNDSAGVRFGFFANTDRGMQQLQDLWVMKIAALRRRG